MESDSYISTLNGLFVFSSSLRWLIGESCKVDPRPMIAKPNACLDDEPDLFGNGDTRYYTMGYEISATFRAKL